MPKEKEADAAEASQNNAEALQMNDELVDMLMLLDYETRFCTKELKPMARTFFAYPASNAGHQFRYFTEVVVWGLGLMRVQATWDEYDDPNSKVANMLLLLKDAGVQVNAVPGKLKQGYGDSVVLLLHALFAEVLKRVGFEYGAPSYPDEGLADEAEVDSDAEIHSCPEDEMPGEGEEDELMCQEDEVKKAGSDSDDDDHAVLEATIDPKDWLLEVERVSPKLKIQLPNDSKEWRTHLKQTHGYKQIIQSQFPGAKAQLEKLSGSLTSALERIRSKEAFINTQFDHRALDYRTQQEELVSVQGRYTELNEVTMALQIELKDVSEELDMVKSEMEDKSSTVMDTAPIVKMKDSFKRLRADTRMLEVRIGVVSHTLMQAKLRQRPQEEDQKKGGFRGKAQAEGEDSSDSDGKGP